MRHCPLAFVDDRADPRLNNEDHHHLARVRRLRQGEEMIVADGKGRWRRAEFNGDSPTPSGPIEVRDRPTPKISVGFALTKSTKPELVVQKLTELGVDRIVPFVSERSVVRWDHNKAAAAHERFSKVSHEAAMQCHQLWLPEIMPVVDFNELIADNRDVALAEAGGDAVSLQRPFVLIGPEGGWSKQELLAVPARVALAGETILRAETAAICAGSLLGALRSGLVS